MSPGDVQLPLGWVLVPSHVPAGSLVTARRVLAAEGIEARATDAGLAVPTDAAEDAQAILAVFEEPVEGGAGPDSRAADLARHTTPVTAERMLFVQAWRIWSALRAAGIAASMDAPDAISSFGAAGPCDVRVAPEDLDAARAVVESLEPNDPDRDRPLPGEA